MRDFTKALEFDWHSYFDDFDLAHGGEPVINGKTRLLYRDGWQYSLTNKAGPEWEPSVDEKLYLQIKYWMIRKETVQQETAYLKNQYQALSKLQDAKDRPLKVFTYVYDEDNKQRKETTDLDLTMIKDRIDWLLEDLKQCEKQIIKLEKSKRDNNGKQPLPR